MRFRTRGRVKLGPGIRVNAGKLGLGLTAFGVLAAAAFAYEPTGDDFRVSTTGNDGDATRIGRDTQIAYNPTANEYLVVWEGNGLQDAGKFEIYGQRLSASGTELGADFRISQTGADDDAERDANDPGVTYNPAANEYLVVWWGDGGATNDVNEIWGQRLSPSGNELGGDFPISDVSAVHADGDAFSPDVAYNSQANQYLVTWSGNGLPTDLEFEVFGQRLNASGGEEGGDFRISNIGTDTDVNRGPASVPRVAYDATNNQYLVVWTGDGLATDNEFEVFGQRVSAAGDQTGGDFRISTVGTDTQTTTAAQVPDVAYSSAANEFLAVWSGADLGPGLGEISGQRVTAAGAEQGGDFRISHATDVASNRDALTPSLAYNPTANEYLVAWVGDVLPTDDKLEVFGQELDATAVPGAAFRISVTGTDTDATRGVLLGTATSFAPGANEYLVAWTANDLPAQFEYEVFARRLAQPASPPTAPATASSTPTTGQRAAALKRCRKKFKGKAKAEKRKRCIKKAKKLPV